MSGVATKGDMFFYGFVLAVMLSILATGFASEWMSSHEVAADQSACMFIVQDETRQFRSCMSGEEIIRYLRQREGIRQ